MKSFGMVMTGLALAARLAAQHTSQFEVGAFGSYTHYDAAFGLANKPGGGVRLGYVLGTMLGVEGDVVFQQQYSVVTGGASTTLEPLIASASVVVNVLHPSQLGVYVLGGYTMLDFGTRAPYNFTDHAAHAGAGARLFVTNRVALRLEGRGVYTLNSQSTLGSSHPKHYVVSLGLSVFHLGGGPKAAPPPLAVAPPPPPPPPAPAPAEVAPPPPKCQIGRAHV